VLIFILHARLRVHQAPGIPCALSLIGQDLLANLGRVTPRECGAMSQLHCERSEAIHTFPCRAMDCFVALLLAMTVVRLFEN
jgi:hypothetical protein